MTEGWAPFGLSRRIPPLKPGRYVLASDGRLHPYRRIYRVQAVAMVTVRALPAKSATPISEPVATSQNCETATPAERCEQPIAAPCAPAPMCRPAKIDLNTVPSAMEQRAASWKGNR